MLAGSALALCFAAPASALDLGDTLGGITGAVSDTLGGATESLGGGGGGATGVDVGVASVSVSETSNGGIGVDAGVNGGGLVNGKAKVTLFGRNGILTTGANANALDDNVTLNSNTTALNSDSLLDTQNDVNLLGTSGTVDATVGGGTGILGLVDPNVCIGSDCGGGTGGGGTGGGTGGGGTGGGIDGSGSGILQKMSSAEVMHYKKTCRGILGNPGGFEANLVQLCRMIAQAG